MTIICSISYDCHMIIIWIKHHMIIICGTSGCIHVKFSPKSRKIGMNSYTFHHADHKNRLIPRIKMCSLFRGVPPITNFAWFLQRLLLKMKWQRIHCIEKYWSNTPIQCQTFYQTHNVVSSILYPPLMLSISLYNPVWLWLFQL